MARILLADRDERFLRACLNELQQDGHEVITVTSGLAALRLAGELAPDVLIAEVQLPGIDGLDLMARVLSNARKTRVILNGGSPWYQDNFLSWAADACLTKAVGMAELRQTVRDVLRTRSAREERMPALTA